MYVVTGDETWLYDHGIASKRGNSALFRPVDQRHVICTLGFRSKKRVFSIFFDYKGRTAVNVLTEKRTIAGTQYTETVLAKVVHKVENQRPTTSTQNVLIHDNASPHKTRAII